jgi:spore maturation protein CgeB
MSENSLRILYVGPLQQGGTSLQRMGSLQDLGYECIPFDMSPYYHYGPLIRRSIAHRLAIGKQLGSLNLNLCQFAKGIDYDYVWIDKGVWIFPETVKKLKKDKAFIIHYTPDAAIIFNNTRHFIHSIPEYNVLITTKTYELQKYKELGAKTVLFTGQGFDPYIFHPYEIDEPTMKALHSDVCFIGHCEGHYYDVVKAVTNATDDVAVWGKWGRKKIFHPWLKRVYRGEGIWREDYAKALCSTKIGLGLLSKLVNDQTTTRTYEITACRTFMLAERTDEHLALFEEGKEAEFFGSNEELLAKVQYYLAHEDALKRIAAAGRERCIKSGYSNHERLKRVMEEIGKLRNS